MEEKKVTTVSLSTFFLILAIIVIIVMGIFMFKLYNEKTEEIEKSSELQTEVNRLNGVVNNLQGEIDNISETINSNNTAENTTTNNTSNNNNTSFTEEQVKTTLSNYLELKSHAGCDALLENLTEKGKLNYDSSKNTLQNDGTVITNIKFSDYKKAMLNYVSESEFEKNWTKVQYFDENSSGYLTKSQGGGDLRVYTIKDISKIDNSTYSANATSVVDDDKDFEENDFTFVVTYYNGNCVIDSME